MPAVDGEGPCGNVEVPPLLMWKSPWEWSYTRRSGMVANIPVRTVRSLLAASEDVPDTLTARLC